MKHPAKETREQIRVLLEGQDPQSLAHTGAAVMFFLHERGLLDWAWREFGQTLMAHKEACREE